MVKTNGNYVLSTLRVEGSNSLLLNSIVVLSDTIIAKITSGSEVELATQLLTELTSSNLLKSSHTDHLYTVASLPRAYPEFISHRSLNKSNVTAGHIVDIGNNCASVLDALLACAFTAKHGDTTTLMCVDAFKSNYRVYSKDTDWLDGAAAIIFGHGNMSLSIRSYVTANITDYINFSNFNLKDEGLCLDITPDKDFVQNDILIEMEVANEALLVANLVWANLNGYITVNRNKSRADKLKNTLRPHGVRLYESRELFGHRGGADIINNLKIAVDDNPKEKSNLFLLVANGLGYTWSAMIIQLITYDKWT